MDLEQKTAEKLRTAFRLWGRVKDAQRNENIKLRAIYDENLKELLVVYEIGVGWFCVICRKHYLKDGFAQTF
jgi:hypothetical protein